MLKFEEIDLDRMVEEVLAGKEIARETASAILNCPDERLGDLLAATRRVREAAFGRRVKICMLRNAQSGICPEDCSYCSQSKISKAEIPVYKMQSVAQLVEGARIAVESGARRYCMVCSMRGPARHDVEHLGEACDRIRAELPQLELCLSIGLMNTAIRRTSSKRAGAGWINHNLNTSRRFYPEICTTHTYDDRIETIENVCAAGLSTCSGGIIGMGETDDDILDLAYSTRRLAIDSVPLNFLHPIKGTPLESQRALTPEKCLKAACLFRLLNPRSEVRAAGGRELNVGARQADLFNAVNSIFVNGYLTTAGWDWTRTRELIERAGYEPSRPRRLFPRGDNRFDDRRKSDGVVILRLAVEGSTTSTRTPVRSTRSASSVATIPSLTARRCAATSASRRNACGVCACHNPARATVATIALSTTRFNVSDTCIAAIAPPARGCSREARLENCRRRQRPRRIVNDHQRALRTG